MFRKRFRAEPAIALTVLYAALSLGARANVPRQDEVYWPQGQDGHSTYFEKPQNTAPSVASYDTQIVRSVQLTGVTRYEEGVFDPYLRYLEHRPLAMPAVDTVLQAITTHYRVDGHAQPRIFACVDDGRLGKLVIAVFEA